MGWRLRTEASEAPAASSERGGLALPVRRNRTNPVFVTELREEAVPEENGPWQRVLARAYGCVRALVRERAHARGELHAPEVRVLMVACA